MLNCLHLLSTYSRMVRIMRMMASMSEPNATVPRWKRVACHMDLAKVKDGTLSFFIVQYHCTEAGTLLITSGRCAPVFLSSITRKTVRCAPPPPNAASLLLFHSQKICVQDSNSGRLCDTVSSHHPEKKIPSPRESNSGRPGWRVFYHWTIEV